MGGSASRELEAAQGQVRRLTMELQKAQTSLKTSVAPKALAEATTARRDLESQLSLTKQQLSSTQQQLASVNSELPKFKKQVAAAKEEVVQVRKAEAEKGTKLTALQQELRTSKEELEQLFGKMKFAEQESLAVRKMRADLSDERKALAEAQQAAAEASARALTEASAALIDETARPGAHPIFGELLHDFGHKRIYLGAPATLWAGTMLWERQRAFRQERASLIASAKARSAGRGWPGSISIVESGNVVPAGGDASIGLLIDGQHRLGAAHLLSKKGKLTGALEQILVEVYAPREEAAIKELFTEINRAEPVLLIDLPDESGGASADDNAVLTAAAEILRERYPGMFKPSHACRPPHLNVDVLRAEMHQTDVLARHSLKTADQLVEWLEARNAALATRPRSEWDGGTDRAKKGTALAKALEKATEHDFFLGLEWGWLKQ